MKCYRLNLLQQVCKKTFIGAMPHEVKAALFYPISLSFDFQLPEVVLTLLLPFCNIRMNGNDLPDLICIITGKGDLKDFYLNKIKEINFNHVKFITPWLSGTANTQSSIIC